MAVNKDSVLVYYSPNIGFLFTIHPLSLCHLTVITFSDDNDKAPDSFGKYTGASLTKYDMPKDFTICVAYMVEAWTTDSAAAELFWLRKKKPEIFRWGKVSMYAAKNHTEFHVNLGRAYLMAISSRVLFPLTWTRVCVSLETSTGNVRLVVNGEQRC